MLFLLSSVYPCILRIGRSLTHIYIYIYYLSLYIYINLFSYTFICILWSVYPMPNKYFFQKSPQRCLSDPYARVNHFTRKSLKWYPRWVTCHEVLLLQGTLLMQCSERLFGSLVFFFSTTSHLIEFWVNDFNDQTRTFDSLWEKGNYKHGPHQTNGAPVNQKNSWAVTQMDNSRSERGGSGPQVIILKS